MKRALIDGTRICQIIDTAEAEEFPVAPPLAWVSVPDDTGETDAYEGGAVVKAAAPEFPPALLLAATDAGVARIVEDLIDLLEAKEILIEDELPQAARDKLAERRAMRAAMG